MKEITKDFKNKKIRIITIDKEPYFSAIDICKAIDIKNASQAMSYLDKDDIISNEVIDSMGRKQIASFLNEGALYQLIFKSRKESAIAFKKWVTHEVLPSIRKTGKYSIPEEVKKMSIKHRNALTAEWSAKGVKQNEYGLLTVEEYRQLFNNTDIRKKHMDKKEILTLSAFEALESLKLYNNSEIGGFADCKISITETASTIKKITGGEK